MSDQLVVISKSELAELISSTVYSELSKLLPKIQGVAPEKRPVVYRNRKYVKNLLHISYPTLAKYSREGKGQLLFPVRIGRRVLYDDAELMLAIPKLKIILKEEDRKKVA